MKDWGDLKFVLALSRAGTMKGAAEALGTNPATVSRRIDRLTNEIGIQLFKRTADGWRPTREAASLGDLALKIDRELDEIENALVPPDRELRGRISVSCYQGISAMALVPNLEAFRERYPNLYLEIEYQPKTSLARGEIDLAIRLQRPKEGRLVSKRIGCRVSGFFRRKGSDAGCDWIGLSREFDDLPMMKQGIKVFGRGPAVRLGSLREIEEAILTTDLVGPLLTCSARHHSGLKQIDDPALVSVRPLYLIYHESRRNDVQLQTAKAWVENCFAGPNRCLCGKCSFDQPDSAT